MALQAQTKRPEAASPELADLWRTLEAVVDPEIPVLTIADLGLLRDAEIGPEGAVTVTITPTYSGCPAMNMIESEIKRVLGEAGYATVAVKSVLHPAWTTDWLSEAGREKLRAYGIAPPETGSPSKKALFGAEPEVACPHCGSKETEQVSAFGSTACKALWRCRSCLEPFDYFKCI
ncbi:1,2-phenylacetyl-CoA epoxidase subunit PaaD [Algihabitans sp.]|uniref:1,2-phenylacetyl-CoA epoxidase subunit PaaD n=1 Tax=Algihabitans sp. TaxID=2821514 RepID=UPI003BACCA59